MQSPDDPKLFTHSIGLLPSEGPRSWRKSFSFASLATQSIDLTSEIMTGAIGNVQAMYVDNADNPSPLTITLLDTLQRIIVPPNSQGVLPFFASQTPSFTIATTVGEFSVPIRLLNLPLPYHVWGTQSVGGGAAGGINRVTLSAGTGTASGASQTILAANAARKFLHIANHSANSASLWVNFGAAAAVGSGMEILPGGSLTMTGAGVSVQDVRVFGTNPDTYSYLQG